MKFIKITVQKIKSITIIGCGRRVRQDVVVSALAAGISYKNIQLLASQQRTVLIRDKIFKVGNLSKSKIHGDWVYFAVPSSKVKGLIQKIKLKIKRKKIIIDTPIVDSYLMKHIKNTHIVAEDTYPLLKKTIYTKLNFYKFNILFFYKSFFYYHGVCFVQTILGKIRFMINLSFIKFFIAEKGIALVLGQRNYENGNIVFNLKTISIPKLNSSDISLIGGTTNFDTFSSRFLDLKRIGLREIFTNPDKFIIEKSLSFRKCYFQYKLSKSFFYLK